MASLSTGHTSASRPILPHRKTAGKSRLTTTSSWVITVPKATTPVPGATSPKTTSSAKPCWSTGRSPNGNSSAPIQPSTPKSSPVTKLLKEIASCATQNQNKTIPCVHLAATVVQAMDIPIPLTKKTKLPWTSTKRISAPHYQQEARKKP